MQPLRVEAAKAPLRTGNKEGARVVIEPLAYSPHGGSGVDLARKVLAALESRGTATAVSVIKQSEKDAKAKAASNST